jgi:LysM repeat protein
MDGIPSNVKGGIRSNVNNPSNMGPSNVNIPSRINPGPSNVNNPSNPGNSNTANTPNSPNTPEVAQELIGGRYVVMPGDSVGRIALRFGTTVGMLVTLNRLTDVNLIQVGQSLLIRPPQPPSLPAPAAPSAHEETRTVALPPPPPPPLPHSAFTPLALPASSAVSGVRLGPALQSWGHKVQPGDTLTIIAEMYNSSVAEIEALNTRLLSQGPDLLQVGSTVMVPLHIIPSPRILSRSAALVRSGDERGRTPGGGRGDGESGGGGGGGGGEKRRGGDRASGPKDHSGPENFGGEGAGSEKGGRGKGVGRGEGGRGAGRVDGVGKSKSCDRNIISIISVCVCVCVCVCVFLCTHTHTHTHIHT